MTGDFPQTTADAISNDRSAHSTSGDNTDTAFAIRRRKEAPHANKASVKGFPLQTDSLKLRPLAQSGGSRKGVAQRLSLGVTREVNFHALWQETLATNLAATGKNGAAGLGFHASPKAVLLLARALGWLVSAFHRT